MKQSSVIKKLFLSTTLLGAMIIVPHAMQSDLNENAVDMLQPAGGVKLNSIRKEASSDIKMSDTYVQSAVVEGANYLRFVTAVKLTEDNNRQLFVPRGFAHGFVSLEEDTIFQYLIDNDYAPKLEAGIKWDDPTINIDWQRIFKENNISEPLLSDKDKIHPSFKENKVVFKREQEKYLITGYNGQLGYDIKRELLKNGIKEENILALGREEMDITNQEQVNSVINNFKPNVIFHCAAWTAVDKAEDMVEEATKVNVDGTRNIVEASINIGAKIVYLSTDYVFDGQKDGIYVPEDETNPQNIYGKTKYLGEKEVEKNPNHFIARTSWVFGINGKNFVKTMLNLSKNHEELNVVDDQIGSPTYTVDLAHILYELSQTDNYGTYHVTNEEFCSWAEFAEYIFKINDIKTKINRVTTEEYLKLTNSKQAYRPKNSRLDKNELYEIGLDHMPSWKDATERYCRELRMRSTK